MGGVTRYTFDTAACRYEHPEGEYVEHEDYAKLASEAQALREERDRIERNRDMWKGQCERQAEKLAALRARVVVVPERRSRREAFECGGVAQEQFATGWNYCLDELARLNGKAVSEGMLREACAVIRRQLDGCTNPSEDRDAMQVCDSIEALIGEGEEHE